MEFRSLASTRLGARNNSITPRHRRNYVAKFNRHDLPGLRLGTQEQHVQDTAQAKWCDLYSFTYQIDGKTKKGGKKTTVWCTLCQQAIHKTGFPAGHSAPVLRKPKGPTSPDMRPVNSGLRANNERNARRSRRNQRGNK